MSEVTITTKFDRKISVEGAGTRGVILTTSDTETCNAISTYLTKKEIRLLVDALEYYAEKTKTSQELFEEMPVGTKFRVAEDDSERVKITGDDYVILGTSIIISKKSVNEVTIVEGD